MEKQQEKIEKMMQKFVEKQKKLSTILCEQLAKRAPRG